METHLFHAVIAPVCQQSAGEKEHNEGFPLPHG